MLAVLRLTTASAEPALHAIELALEAFGLVAKAGDLGEQRRRVLAPALQSPDLLRQPFLFYLRIEKGESTVTNRDDT